MDNAFQELDYSDISAKNLKKRPNEINTKTRGGLIRLGSIFIIGVVILILIIGIISKSNTLSKLKNELKTLKENIGIKEREKSYTEEKNIFLANEILETQKNAEKLSKEKSNIENNIETFQRTNKKSKSDIQNAQDAISLIEEKLKEFESIKKKVDDLQKSTEYYSNEIDKLKKKN